MPVIGSFGYHIIIWSCKKRKIMKGEINPVLFADSDLELLMISEWRTCRYQMNKKADALIGKICDFTSLTICKKEEFPLWNS